MTPDVQQVLQRRDVVHEPGIADVWLGDAEHNSGMARLEASCRHSLDSARDGAYVVMDDGLRVLHERSARRGIRSRVVVRTARSAVVCASSSCPCQGSFLGESTPVTPISFHLVDDRIARIKTSTSELPASVLVTDHVVLSNLRQVFKGIMPVSKPVLPRDRRRDLRPTLRQLRILHLMSYGLTDEKIAAELKVTSRTVRNDVAGLNAMFEVQSRFELGAAYSRWMAGH
ncbi:helix-turn-helix transcriptional regulator [Luteipulveratus sp. YIM 133296]|uniref:Helix-turn-helix transcriptional regulator n=2 Tax=Luteipulveratus flavus TaxID=3031728 RepID=A0ABT6C884_9MICO|nr:helix-turn-helix transcriptional regulator [Luteipulveratus sp. YIM 133296]MDF8265080.1 helix-turn-helix transcriptional regulator [Luteipulveratus sp. YIM 133296]